MATKLIQSERIRELNDKSENPKGDYLLYWMQQSQRAECNHALEFAIQRANGLKKPLVVGFGLMDDYPEANLRHYTFMLEGLQETASALERRGIRFVIRHGHPADVALDLGAKAAAIVCDRGYLRHQRQCREKVGKDAKCKVWQVESDVVVPVEEASDKREYAARTIRPKIRRKIGKFLEELTPTPLENDSLGMKFKGMDLAKLEPLLDKLRIDRGVPAVPRFFKGGTAQARARLKSFIENSLSRYDDESNRPDLDSISQLSPYLHFGQISPVYIAMQIREAKGVSGTDIEAFLEQLIVRRELSMNFVYFTPDYDSFKCLPDWAKKTLEEHKEDKREHVYTRRELAEAQTHDPYWNAAMKEMRHTGFMHNYMRMYWGKKILEWTNTPETAYRTALALNNKYFLDGRDPNSFTSVAWLFGLHDRPWQEREIFGKVRYMSAGGLESKAHPKDYVKKVEAMIGENDEK